MSNHAMAMNKVLQDNVNYQHHDRTVGKSKKKWGHVLRSNPRPFEGEGFASMHYKIVGIAP